MNIQWLQLWCYAIMQSANIFIFIPKTMTLTRTQYYCHYKAHRQAVGKHYICTVYSKYEILVWNICNKIMLCLMCIRATAGTVHFRFNQLYSSFSERQLLPERNSAYETAVAVCTVHRLWVWAGQWALQGLHRCTVFLTPTTSVKAITATIITYVISNVYWCDVCCRAF